MKAQVPEKKFLNDVQKLAPKDWAGGLISSGMGDLRLQVEVGQTSCL